MNKKKVLFVPGYFYLATDQFIQIAHQLGDKVDCSFVKVLSPGASFNKVNSEYNQEFFKKYALNLITIDPFIHLGIINDSTNESCGTIDPSFNSKLSLSLMAKRLLIRLNRLYGGDPIPLHYPIREHTNIPIIQNICKFYYSTKRIIHHFRNIAQMLHDLDDKNPFIIAQAEIEKIQPDLVIVNSDLGHIGILYLLEICRLAKIEVLILPTCDIETENTGLKHSIENYLSKRLFRTHSPKWSYNRSNNFNARVVGKFCLDSKILTPSETIKTKLIEREISPNRIEVCDFPKAPTISSLETNIDGQIKRKKIVFYTECLHEIFDASKVIQAHYEIAETLNNLQKKHSVEIIVKPHPRELTDKKNLERVILEPFSKYGIKVCTDTPTNDLISSAFLNIAHYSKVLITSCTLGRPIISLSLSGEKAVNTFLLDSDNEILSVTDNSNLEAHITNIIEDAKTFQSLVASTLEVGSRYKANDGHRPVSQVLMERLFS